jgi:pyruvate dehydrogenase complex dehydrogenase (E1) component
MEITKTCIFYLDERKIIQHPEMVKGQEEGIIKGMYLPKEGGKRIATHWVPVPSCEKLKQRG